MLNLKREIIKENHRRKLHNEFVPMVQTILEDYVGKKITKIDGLAVKKLNDEITKLRADKKSFFIYLQASYSAVRIKVRDSYYDDKNEIQYIDDAFLVGEYELKKSESGILGRITHFEPMEYIDYDSEVKKINHIQKLLNEVEPQLEELSYISRKQVKENNWRFFR